MSDRTSLRLYIAIGVAYVTVGVFVPEVLFSWVEGAAVLLLGAWIVPALLRRLRR